MLHGSDGEWERPGSQDSSGWPGKGWGGACIHLQSLALPGLPWVQEMCEGGVRERLRLTPAPELTPCGKEEEVYSGIA